MIQRTLKSLVSQRLKTFPAVALLGPRQSGKTTLARTFTDHYYDLEQEQDRLRVDVEWENIVNAKHLAVFDEAQEMPQLFPRLRSAIDTDRRRNGRFLLLGSVSPSLMQRVSDSLAGRLALCELTPLLASELPKSKWDAAWRMGGYPHGGILDAAQFPRWQKDYLELLAQRDLPHWGLTSQPRVMLRFFQMLAAIHGQTWNASQLGQSLGLSYHTVNKYADFLEQTFLVRRLPPYFANIRKRLVKSPKIYWRDSGLLHSLLGLEEPSALLTRPWVGASWEGWVIEQILSSLGSRGESFQAHYFRTSDQHEIDLLLEYRDRLWAFEIKLTTAPSPQDLEKLDADAALVKADGCFLVSRIPTPTATAKRGVLNVEAVLEMLGSL